MRFSIVSALALAGIVCASGAQAVVVSADFRSDLDLPAFSASGPRVLERIGQSVPNAGFELDESDEIANPSSWNDSLQVDFDPTTNIVTLTPTGSNVYQTLDIVISNMSFSVAEHVVGFAALSTGNAVIPNNGTFSMTTAFTGNSVTISYFADDIPAGDFFGFGPGSDTFQVTVDPVPVPAALPLMAAAIGGLAIVARRRR